MREEKNFGYRPGFRDISL